MEKHGNMVLYSWEEILDKRYGPIGTPKRDEFEARVAQEVIRDNERVAKQEARREARKAKLQSLVQPLVNAINKVSDGQAQVARP